MLTINWYQSTPGWNVWGKRTRGERPDGEDWTGCRASFTACVHDVIHCRLALSPTGIRRPYVTCSILRRHLPHPTDRQKNRRLLTSTHACTAKITSSVTDPSIDQACCFVCEYVTRKTSYSRLYERTPRRVSFRCGRWLREIIYDADSSLRTRPKSISRPL